MDAIGRKVKKQRLGYSKFDLQGICLRDQGIWNEEETFDHAIESRTKMEREIDPIPTDIAA